jgi:hypothetical protein
MSPPQAPCARLLVIMMRAAARAKSKTGSLA